MNFIAEDGATMRRVMERYGVAKISFDLNAPPDSRWLVQLFDNETEVERRGTGPTFTTAVYDAETAQ